jgi:tripartite-type tricarboxylate transporter receptor subunit TctC
MKSLLCAVIAAAGLVAPLQAQQYPSKPVRIIIGMVPGGPIDALARALAQSFSVSMGQSFVVENRAGGNLVIAAETVARAAPNGYTLLITPEFAMTVNPSAYSALSYSPVKDFSPVSILAVNNFTICSNSAKLPGAGFADMLAYAKAKPGELSYGVASTLGQLMVEQMKLEQRVDLLHVPYKG